ncbi:hypothetical protein ZWY2020_012919 [Hordeum vulgare]|nr:hypothetical protein ZWY2020_012919 [Hordeum vulgare]
MLAGKKVHVSASASARQPSPPPACYGSPPSAVGLPAASRALRRRPCLGSASAPATSPAACLLPLSLAGAAAVAMAFPALLPAPSASSRDHGAAASPHAARGQPPRLTRPGPAAVAHTAGVLRRPSPLSAPP